MRTRKQFEAAIKEQLQSFTWRKLQNSLLGKELITFGAVVAELVEGAYFKFLDNLSPEYSDLRGLFLQARTFGVSYDHFTPPQLSYKAISQMSAETGKLSVSIGNIVYYNKDFLKLKEGDQVTLVQAVKRVSTLSNTSSSSDFISTVNASLDEGTQIKLPEFSIADSVQVFFVKNVETSQGITRVLYPQPVNREVGTENNVIVYREVDKTLDVLIKEFVGYDDIEISFLEAQFQVPANPTGVQTFEGVLTEVSNILFYTEDVSLENARLRLNLAEACKSAIATKEQIRQCANTFVQVLDSNPVMTGPNECTVWVKPEYVGEDNLQVVRETLAIYGEMFVTWLVKEGLPVYYSVLLSDVKGNLTQQNKIDIQAQIKSWVEKNSEFLTEVTPAWLLQSLPELANSISAVVLVEQTISGTLFELNAKPEQLSLDFDQGKAWDTQGFILSYKPKGLLSDLSVWQETAVGDCIVEISNKGFAVFDKSLNRAEVQQSLWPIPTGELISVYSTKDSYSLITKEGNVYKLWRLKVGNLFGDSDVSLMRNNNQVVSWDTVTTFATAPFTTETSFVDTGNFVFTYKDGNLIRWSLTDTVWNTDSFGLALPSLSDIQMTLLGDVVAVVYQNQNQVCLRGCTVTSPSPVNTTTAVLGGKTFAGISTVKVFENKVIVCSGAQENQWEWFDTSYERVGNQWSVRNTATLLAVGTDIMPVPGVGALGNDGTNLSLYLEGGDPDKPVKVPITAIPTLQEVGTVDYENSIVALTEELFSKVKYTALSVGPKTDKEYALLKEISWR